MPVSALPRWLVLGCRAALLLALVTGTWLAVMPVAGTPLESVNDKLQHLLAFLLLALLLDLSLPGARPAYWAWKLPLLAGYGLLIECVQYFLPHRSFSLLDLAVDLLGLALYGLVRPALRRLPGLRQHLE